MLGNTGFIHGGERAVVVGMCGRRVEKALPLPEGVTRNNITACTDGESDYYILHNTPIIVRDRLTQRIKAYSGGRKNIKTNRRCQNA